MSQSCFVRRLVGLLAQAKLRLSGARPPAVTGPAASGHSLFIGPANSAGQAFFWAQAVTNVEPQISATSMAVVRPEDVFGFAVDSRVAHGYAVYSRGWQKRQFAALELFDTVVLESGLTAVPGVLGGDTLAQIRALETAGARVALLFHGSDIRDPDRHMETEPHSHFQVDSALTQRLREVTRANKALAAAADVPVLVSTPDLVDEVPDAMWLPLVVNPAKWQRPEGPLRGESAIKVVHVPSSSKLKGTELIMPTLQRLEAEGVVSLESVSRSTHEEMPARYGRADVVIDQLRAGSYGVAACEALAAGRVVISHVSEAVRARVREWTGDELPIIQATPDTLDAVLREIEAHRERFREIAAQGPDFIARHHSGDRSGQVLARLCFPDDTVPVIGRDA